MANRVHRHPQPLRRIRRTFASANRRWLLMLIARTLASALLMVLSHLLASMHGWHL